MQKNILLFIFIFVASNAFAGLSNFANASGASQSTDHVLPCKTPTKNCESTFEIVPGRKLTYTRTFDLDVRNENITSAILMIHASDRVIPWGYNQLNGLMDKGLLSKDTLVVAPLLMAPADKPAPGWLYWAANDWSAGFDSIDGSKTSSFFVVDELIRKMIKSGNFPNLRTLIITGFSAGGQATQRYAMGTEVDHEFPNVHFRFIVGSPSSYVYLNDQRWVPGTQYDFANPLTDCEYNNYRYGLERVSNYMSTRSASEMVKNFLERDIHFIVGELDDATARANPPIERDPKDARGLDLSCGAQWQGASRLQRSFLFHQYLLAEFPQYQHGWLSVPGVAHSYHVYDDQRVVALLNFRD